MFEKRPLHSRDVKGERINNRLLLDVYLEMLRRFRAGEISLCVKVFEIDLPLAGTV